MNKPKAQCKNRACPFPARYTCRVCGKPVCAFHSLGKQYGRVATCGVCYAMRLTPAKIARITDNKEGA